MARALAITLGVAALATAVSAATARAEVFVAYGEDATVCTIEVVNRHYKGITTGGEPLQDFSGETDCSVPLEQTAHATIGTDPDLDGGLCSGVRESCFSGREEVLSQTTTPMVFRMTLRAPLGQGWLGAPTNCTGVGTDNLKCEFVVERSWTPDLTREWLP